MHNLHWVLCECFWQCSSPHELRDSCAHCLNIQDHPSTAGSQALAPQQAVAVRQPFRCCWARSRCRAWARTLQTPAAAPRM